ncbi:sugar transferase, partial [Myxococcota bacterium]
MHDRFDKIAPGIPAKLTLVTDAVLVILALVAACGGLRLVFEIEIVALAVAAVASWFFSAAVFRLYSPCTPRKVLDNMTLGFLGVATVTIGIAAFHTLLSSAHNGFDPLLFILLLYPTTTLTRVAFFERLVARSSDPKQRILIVGVGPSGLATYERIVAQEKPQPRMIGFLRFSNEASSLTTEDVPILGDVKDARDVLAQHAVSEVYVAGQPVSQGLEMQEAVAACEEVGVPFAVPLHSLEFQRAALLSSPSMGDGYLHYLTTQSAPVSYAIKRLIDISASGLALMLLSPLLVGVAIAIKLTSSGPILFRQVRVGLYGSRFNLLKFRSMVSNAEALKRQLTSNNEQTGPVFKIQKDPRITAVGRFIRKYSIDELPQLVNILRGEMTIVGPRPALPDEVAQYKAWQRRRLSVRPGLTCFWQVSGRNEIGFEDWMRLDLQYVDNWSVGLDAQLILRT